jgi:hypothetical protein
MRSSERSALLPTTSRCGWSTPTGSRRGEIRGPNSSASRSGCARCRSKTLLAPRSKPRSRSCGLTARRTGWPDSTRRCGTWSATSLTSDPPHPATHQRARVSLPAIHDGPSFIRPGLARAFRVAPARSLPGTPAAPPTQWGQSRPGPSSTCRRGASRPETAGRNASLPPGTRRPG